MFLVFVYYCVSHHKKRIPLIQGHPKYLVSRLGVFGSGLALKNDHYDYLGSSYADTSDVRDFWLKNNFILIRLGNKLDQSSGTRSGLVIKGLSESGKQIAVKTTVFFNQQKNKTQSFQSLSKTEQKLIGHFINSTGSYEATKDILSRNENWKALFKDKEFPKKAGIDFRELVKKWAEN